MSVRPATPADIERLVDLNSEVHDLHVAELPAYFKPVSRADLAAYFADMLEAPGARVFVACNGPEVVGYMLLVLRERPANIFAHAQRWLEIDQIGVTAAHRGQGHAAALVEAARALAKEYSLGRIELHTWGFNERAQAFFRAQGFQTQGIKMGMDV